MDLNNMKGLENYPVHFQHSSRVRVHKMNRRPKLRLESIRGQDSLQEKVVNPIKNFCLILNQCCFTVEFLYARANLMKVILGSSFFIEYISVQGHIKRLSSHRFAMASTKIFKFALSKLKNDWYHPLHVCSYVTALPTPGETWGIFPYPLVFDG